MNEKMAAGSALVTDTAGNIGSRIKEFWQSFSFDELLARFGLQNSPVVQGALYFVVAFAIGFLCKKYFKFLMWAVLFTAFAVKFFEYHSVLTIDWNAFNLMMGFQPDASLQGFFNNMTEWVKVNWIETIAGTIGLLLGLRFG